MKQEFGEDVAGLLPEKDFGRRDFMWTALGASAALALANSASGQTVTTDVSGLDVADVSIPTATGDLRGYRAMPDKGGPFPVVLVAAEVFGLNPYMAHPLSPAEEPRRRTCTPCRARFRPRYARRASRQISW